MTLQSDLLVSLTNDAALMALLTGGVFSETRISRQTTPTAFDANSEIKPCLLINTGTDTTVGPYRRGSRVFPTLYFYQFRGYTTINTARDRVYDLWHDQRVGAATWRILHTDDVNGQVDDVLSCSLVVSHYTVLRLR
jgi:hypothetical protein